MLNIEKYLNLIMVYKSNKLIKKLIKLNINDIIKFLIIINKYKFNNLSYYNFNFNFILFIMIIKIKLENNSINNMKNLNYIINKLMNFLNISYINNYVDYNILKNNLKKNNEQMIINNYFLTIMITINNIIQLRKIINNN